MAQREYHIEVPRSARYVTLGDPHGHLDQVWIVCHGYGQLVTRFVTDFQVLDDGTRLIVAPEGLSRFYVDHAAGVTGASWMTKEDRQTEIVDYVNYLDMVADHVLGGLGREAVALHLLGFSQGAATVSRWVAYGRVRPDRIILWAGAIPPDVDLTALRCRLDSADLSFVVGDADRIASPDELLEQEAVLSGHGLKSSVVRFAGGHRLDETVLLELG
jgi:predicted esterase